MREPSPDRSARTLAYVVKTFPKVSETFILHEIVELEARGLPLEIFSLQRPTDPIVHRLQERVRASCLYPPTRLLGRENPAWAAHLRLLVRHPYRYARALLHALSRIEGFNREEFVQAGWIGERLLTHRCPHLHAHFATSPTGLAELVSVLTGIPYSFTGHAKDLFLSNPKVLQRKIHRARFVLTCTHRTRNWLDRLSANETPIHCSYHGLDLHRFQPDPTPIAHSRTETPLLLSVGRFREKKGFLTLLEACRLLAQNGLRFRCVIIGYGPQQSELEQYIREHRLESIVHLAGQQPQEEVIAYYRQASLFALPCQTASDGDQDGIPNVLIEAMAMELPVVSTPLSGIPELIDQGTNGLLVNESDPRSLAHALTLLLRDSDLRRRLGKAARKTVQTHFSIEPNISQILELFRPFLDHPLTDSRAHTAQLRRNEHRTLASVNPPVQGTIGYILKGFPRNSEAFITQEIALLESMGLPIKIFSVKAPPSETPHAIVSQITASVTYLPRIPSLTGTPFLRWLAISLPKFTRSHLALMRTHPIAYFFTLGEALRMMIRYRSATFSRFKKVFFKEFLQAGFIAAEVLQYNDIQHLHAHFCHGATTIGMFAGRLAGLPFSFTAHAKDIYVPTLNPCDLLQQKMQRSEFVVTCTESNRRHLESLRTGSTPIVTIYHGLDTNRFVFQPRPPAEIPLILSVGRLVEKKGFAFLVRACANLRDRGWTFQCKIIGEPDDQLLPIHTLIRDLGLSDIVRLEPAKTQEALRREYHQASIFVLPCQIVENGDRDGIPNVLAEAMATGLPVISTTISGIPELISDGEDGLLIPEKDIPALSQAMEHLLGDHDLRARLGKAGREKILRIFDAQRNTRLLQHLFQEPNARGSGDLRTSSEPEQQIRYV